MESLHREVFVPLRINLKKGQKAYYSKPDKNIVTPLSKILVKAYILQKRLLEKPEFNQSKFCKLNKILPRYFRAIMQFNFLSPKLKKRIRWLDAEKRFDSKDSYEQDSAIVEGTGGSI